MFSRNYMKDSVTEDTVGSVHNYYERVVFEQILRSNDRAKADAEYFSDVACVALNRLPPRYVRHDVDMTFFLSPMELEEITDKVVSAVNHALDYVDEREKLKNETKP